MPEIFCNIDNTGVTDGTSFATGFTDIRDAFNGATVGDNIYISAGSTAYEISGSNVYASNDNLAIKTTNPTVHTATKFIGISGGDTGSLPMGDDRPLILCNRTNGTSVFFPEGSRVENLRFDGEMYTGNNNTSAHVSTNRCTVINVEVKVRDRTDGVMFGDRAMGLVSAGATKIIACSFVTDVSSSSLPTRDSGYEAVNAVYEGDMHECVFHNKGNAPILAFNRMRSAYGNGGNYTNCIFIGSGNETLYTAATTCHTQSMSAVRIKNCIFYNLSSALKPHIPISTTNSFNTETEMQNKIDTIRVHDCLFVNCNIGAETPAYSDPSGWSEGLFTLEHVFRLHKCAFYNNTVSNTSGVLSNISPIQLSADPFVDSVNFDFTLNDDPNGGKKIKDQDIVFTAQNSKIQARLYGASVMFRGQSAFSVTDSGSLSLGTGGVGDTVTVSGRSFQKISDNPIVWRRV